MTFAGIFVGGRADRCHALVTVHLPRMFRVFRDLHETFRR